ncbi:MAG: PDZ domain-containing protein [Bacteroidetes bacterium]|nr:PDZ domain-containing protein [Bacteroidota bacterium]
MNQFKYLKYLLFLVFILSGISGNSQAIYEQTFKFGRVLEWLDRYYVDSVNQEELVEEAIIEMLDKLDPHSVYISKKEVEKMNEPLQGNFEGIGIYFNVLHDTVLVISTISGGPSEKVGLRAGDRIVKIEGEDVAGTGITNSQVMDKLRGEKGTNVTVSIKRRSVDKLLDFTITRDKIPIYSLDASYKVEDNIGYIKLNRFSFTTMEEFAEAVKPLKEQGVEHLILDLTGNGGGYLEVAVNLADQFLKEDQLVVYTKGLNNPRKDFKATANGAFENDGRVVVLIDEGSASASEIVSGAIQDWDRGLVVGRRSFGKGLVQSPLMLPDQSMIRLTVARYYTPTGRLIQKPYDDGAEAYARDLTKRYEKGEFTNKDSIQFPDSLKYYTIRKNRLVYGGGGIMPDIFIPLDTTGYTDYLNDIMRKGILNSYVLSYVDANRKSMHKKYPSFDDFINTFEVEQEMLDNLIEYAKDERLLYDKDEFEQSRSEIELIFKAYVARDLWTQNEFHQIMNQENPMFDKAVEIIKSAQLFSESLK